MFLQHGDGRLVPHYAAYVRRSRGTTGKLLQGDLFDLGAGGDVKRKGEEVFGPDVDALREDKESDTADNASDEMDVHGRVLLAWELRKPKRVFYPEWATFTQQI